MKIGVRTEDILQSRLVCKDDFCKTDVDGLSEAALGNILACDFHPQRRSCPENAISCRGKVYGSNDDFMQEMIKVYPKSSRN